MKFEDSQEKEQFRLAEYLSKIERPIDSKNRALRKQKSFKHVLEFIKKMKEEAGKKNQNTGN